MTPDLDEIRRVLAVDRTALTIEAHDAHYAIRRNAPTWLAALCAEVERLRNTDTDVEITQNYVDGEPTTWVMRVVRNGPNMQAWVRISIEMIGAITEEHNELSKSRSAWRACADQLAACFDEWMLQAAPVREALAEYERLKDQT